MSVKVINGKTFEVERGSAAGVTVKVLWRTCEACPAQWEGETDDGREVYIRYRGAHGYVVVAAAIGTNVFDGYKACSYERMDANAPLDGYLSEDELRALAGEFVTFPEKIT
jgi:hypothetical protein